MHTYKKITGAVTTFIYVLAVIVLIAGITCFICHIKPAVVVSGSMEPVIHTGSVAFINKNDVSADTGDIIAFNNNGILITHRVISSDGDKITTKGDANESIDPWTVDRNSVVGTTIFSIPYVGYIIKFLTSKTGIILIVTLAVTLMLPSLLYKKSESYARDNK